MAYDEKYDDSYKVLGMGAYGAVFSPAIPNEINGEKVPFPQQVTKIFYEKENYNRLSKKSNNISRLLPSLPVLRPYRRTMKANQLPPSVRNYVALNSTNNVWMMHMPHVGTSFETLLRYNGMKKEIEKIQSCSILHVLEQLQQLLSSTRDLSTQGYVHGDIHLGNLTVQHEDCTFHLIDFDRFDTFEEFYKDARLKFGLSSEPPESLFLAHIQRLPEVIVPVILPLARENMVEEFKKTNQPISDIKEKHAIIEYTEELFQQYAHVWNHLGMDKNRLFQYVQHAIRLNANYLYKQKKMHQRSTKELLNQHVFPYYDNYRLGLCLAEFLLHLYPLPKEEEPEDFLPFMRSHHQLPSKRATHLPFTKQTVDALHRTIDLLLQMSHFYLSKRPLPQQAYERMTEIVDDYRIHVQYSFTNTSITSTRKNRSNRS